MVELTEKLLMDAGGWQAMKEARAIYETGRVIEAAYEPPVLAGRVRGADSEYRAGLLVKSRTDIENTCPCPTSRRRGLICAHSLAVGVAVIRGLKKEPQAKPPQQAAPPAVPAMDPNFSTDGGGTPAMLHVILPPNFAAAWEKGSVMAVFEIETDGRRRPLGGLDATARFRVGAEDAALVGKLRSLTGGRLPAMATLKPGEFSGLLAVLAGHPRVTFGKSQPVQIAKEPARPRLRVERRDDGSLRICTDAPPGLLLANASAWSLESATLRPVAPGLPPAYFVIFRGPLEIPADAAETFAARELPALSAYVEIEGDAASTAATELPEPAFAALIEGSLNFLSARVEAIYGARRVTLDATGAALARFARNRAAENAAIERLRVCGFSGPDGKGDLTLKGEQRILAFFASVLPRLEREWSVTVGERFAHVTRDVTRIVPRLEIRGSGEQWFELSYELAAADGERFSGAEITRLLEGGRSHVRRANGKVAVFDPVMLDDFTQMLRDCAPRQAQPGVYRMDRAHAGAFDGFAEENGVQIGGDSRWRAWAAATRNLERLEAVPLGPLESQLRDYQKYGVYWLHFLAQNGFGGILADEMGLGKTLQALAFLQTLTGTGPSLVVCPSSLIFNWCAEAARWTPGLRLLQLDGARRAESFSRIAQSDIVVTSYPLLRRDADSYRDVSFAAVVLDEAQHIKNPDSQNAQAATSLKARHRFVLTGTPVENSVRDIWSLMNFLMPGYLGRREEFREHYEQAISSGSGTAEQRRLMRRIRPFLLRRTKKGVAKDIPDKIEQVSFCELTGAQKEIYAALATATRRQVAELDGSKNASKARMVMLTALLRLRQAACDARLLNMENPPSDQEASGKLELLEELLAEALDGGHRVLVFSQFVTMLGIIRERLDAVSVGYCYLDGQSEDRAAQVAKFQSGGAPVFLISLKAGGTGLNLTAADTVIHFDPWWNPAVEAQATDRAHRIGQKRTVTSYKLITRGTVEEKILALQQRKREVIAATVESEEPVMEALSMEEIRSLLT